MILLYIHKLYLEIGKIWSFIKTEVMGFSSVDTSWEIRVLSLYKDSIHFSFRITGYMMSCFILTVLLSAVLQVSAVWSYEFYCHDIKYNLTEKICCDSKLFDLYQDGQRVDCCTTSGKIYKPGSDICCGDVYNKSFFEEHNFSCCNGKPIKKEREICCGGEIILSEEGRGCCGNKSFELRKGRCCKDQLYHRNNFKGKCCGSNTYDNKTHYCYETNAFEEVLPINIQRCGNITINRTTHTCCNNGQTPVDITEYKGDNPPLCCGTAIIPDRKAFHCVRNQVLPMNQSLCINETDTGVRYKVFNLNEEWCCNGNVTKKNASSGRREQCCGTHIIDSSTHQCCGTHIIDSSTHQCCAGKHPYVFEYCCGDTLVYSKEKCCGTTVLTKKMVCCNESNGIFPVKKRKRYHDACCNGRSYQRAGQTCPRLDHTQICGSQPFNKSEDVCCSNKLHKGAKGPDIQCCGASIYNVTYQNCIYGRPSNKTEDGGSTKLKQSVCGKKRRIRKKDLCCLNHFHKNAKHEGLRCCGAEVYNMQTQKCCYGKAVPLNSTSCTTNRRGRRHKPKPTHPQYLICSSQGWVRRNVLRRIDCIEEAYVLQKVSKGDIYRTKKALPPKNRHRRTQTWNATSSCNHVLRRRRFIHITTPSLSYTLKNSSKSWKLIKQIPLCKIS